MNEEDDYIMTYPLYPVPRYDSFPAYLRGIYKNFAPQPAITCYTRFQEERTHTYAAFVGDADALAAALAGRGLKGRHIAVVGENCYEWLAAFLGITGGGSVAVCIDAEQPDTTIREMLLRADVEAAFVSPSLAPICTPLLESGALRYVFAMDEGAEGPDAFSSLVAEGRSGLEAGETGIDDAVSPDRTAMIVYTSGTTGVAKPVMLSHRALLWNASSSIAMVNPRKTVFTALPLYHTYSLNCAALNDLSDGAHLFLNGDLKTMLRDLIASRAGMVVAVPLMVQFLYQQIMLEAERQGKREEVRRLLRRGVLERLGLPRDRKLLQELKESAIGACDLIICGGAHLDREISEALRLFGVLVLQGYGITECSPLVSVNRNEACVMGTVGLVLPDWEFKLSDGEILVRGPSLMQGYYKDEALTAESLEDGWFKTGDLGSVDENGFLSITGRCKNLIVFKNGKKISPEKVEEVLKHIPLVGEVVVYGAP
ncbi:MAG TPA: AMP-binding protein, partial [Oscillospiraceae bacterium]|nr:AMP-binding protein [Oscillospiraceae bacterium]